MPRRSTAIHLGRALEDLRQGTREQFEGDWIRVEAGASKAILHGLAEVPHTADAIFSLLADGQKPVTAPSGVTLSRDETNVTVTNGSATGGWFKVRAT